jgi:hypothetical protein
MAIIVQRNRAKRVERMASPRVTTTAPAAIRNRT